MKTKILLLAIFAFFLLAIPITIAAPVDRPGSALLFPIFKTNSSNPEIQNTMIVLHNTNMTDSVTVRCVFVYRNGAYCMQNSTDLTLAANTPTELDINSSYPDKTGYVICAAINPEDESLKAWDYLLGNAWLKTADGVTGSYAPTIYFANFSGSITNTGQLKLGTDYIPGVPSSVYVSGSPALAGNSLRLYAGSSINPSAVWPYNDIVAGSQAGVKNRLTGITYNKDESAISSVIALGNCSDMYNFSTITGINATTYNFWVKLTSTVSATLYWGELPSAVFANHGGFNFVRGIHNSVTTSTAYLPFDVGYCGDNIAQPGELCDGTDLRSETCANFGYNNGTLACNGACDAFNTSGCFHSEICNNGIDDDNDTLIDCYDVADCANDSWCQPVNITDCQSLGQGRPYSLQNDTTITEADCFPITANNVMLDCNGHTVDGALAEYNGISADTKTGITIQNCTLINWVEGIYFTSTSNSSLINNTANNNTQYGIYLAFSDNNNLTENTASYNTILGIYLSSSSSNTLTNNIL